LQSQNGAPNASVSISSVSLPQPLFQSAAVTYTDPVSGQTFIFVIGGAYYDLTLTADPINVNTVHKYRVAPNGALTYLGAEITNLPNIRGHSAVVYNNSIYVIGGIATGGFQSAIYEATIKMDDTVSPPVPVLNEGNNINPWSWIGDLPVAETGQESIISGNFLFVIGGVESGLPGPNCSPNCVGSQTTVFSNKIYGYDLTLTSFASTTATVFTMPKALFTPAAVVVPNNQFWVFGGWDGNTNSDTAYPYTSVGTAAVCVLLSCQSETLPYGGISKAKALYLPALDQLFLIGGASGSLDTQEVITRSVYTASPVSPGPLSWSPLPSLPQPILCFSAAASGSSIYLFGGIVNGDC
jgi:hypothetical protein